MTLDPQMSGDSPSFVGADILRPPPSEVMGNMPPQLLYLIVVLFATGRSRLRLASAFFHLEAVFHRTVELRSARQMRSGLSRPPALSEEGGIGSPWTTRKGSTSSRRCCPRIPVSPAVTPFLAPPYDLKSLIAPSVQQPQDLSHRHEGVLTQL